MQVPKTCQTQILTGHILLEHHPRNLFERAFQLMLFSHFFFQVEVLMWCFQGGFITIHLASPRCRQFLFRLGSNCPAIGGIVGMKKWRDITRYSYMTSWFLDLKKDHPLDWENDDPIWGFMLCWNLKASTRWCTLQKNTARKGWTVFEDVFIYFLQEMGISHCQVSFPFWRLHKISVSFGSWLRHQGLWTCGTTQTEQLRSFGLCGADSFTILWATWTWRDYRTFQPVIRWLSEVKPPPNADCWWASSVRDSTPPACKTSGKFRYFGVTGKRMRFVKTQLFFRTEIC